MTFANDTMTVDYSLGGRRRAMCECRAMLRRRRDVEICCGSKRPPEQWPRWARFDAKALELLPSQTRPLTSRP